jgi:hypothetical protein
MLDVTFTLNKLSNRCDWCVANESKVRVMQCVIGNNSVHGKNGELEPHFRYNHVQNQVQQ